MFGGSHFLDAAFNLTFSLDSRFGQPRKFSISQRDGYGGGPRDYNALITAASIDVFLSTSR